MTKVTCLLACALVCASIPDVVRADSRADLDDAYFGAKLTLGIGGSVESSAQVGNVDIKGESDLDVTIGVAGQYIVPLHRFFALGGLVGLSSWRSSQGGDADGGRNWVFDLALVPEGRFVATDSLELYVGMPLGLSLDVLNEINRSNRLFSPGLGELGAVSLDGGSALGFMIAGLFGARYRITGSFGLFAEFGYTYRTFSHSVEATVGVAGLETRSSRDVSVSFGQFALNLGAFF